MNEQNEYRKALDGLRDLRIELKNGTTRIVCMDSFLDTTIRLQKQLKLAEKSLEFMAANHEAVSKVDVGNIILSGTMAYNTKYYVIVPREPTEAMQIAATICWPTDKIEPMYMTIWKAMLAAAKLSQGD